MNALALAWRTLLREWKSGELGVLVLAITVAVAALTGVGFLVDRIGIAVDTEKGLIVPVLRDADRKNIPQIARELVEIADAARKGTFKVEDLRGGTFTISNLGAIGGTYSTPIINPRPRTSRILLLPSPRMPSISC